MSSNTTQLGSHAAHSWQVSADHADLVRAHIVPRPQHIRSWATNGQVGKTLTLDLARTAVIVIDMQNDFCHTQGWLASIGVDVSAARKPIAPLLQFLPQCRAHAMPVIWVNWGNRPDRANLSPALLHVYNPDGRSHGLGAELPSAPAQSDVSCRVLEKNSWGAAVVDELMPEPTDLAFDKFRMSGFWDTALDATLRQMGITTLLFAGINADQCVLATLMDANFLGYDTLLLEDASATTSPDYCWQATLYNVRQCFGFTTLTTEFFK